MAIGRAFANSLSLGMVVALVGTLGSGKTLFARGTAEALGVEGPVTSPTFTLVHQYPTSPPLLHIDLYRISGAEEFLHLGIAERFPECITLVEWPEHAGDELDAPRYTVTIKITGEQQRSITISPDPERGL